jgi:hypothetical protein
MLPSHANKTNNLDSTKKNLPVNGNNNNNNNTTNGLYGKKVGSLPSAHNNSGSSSGNNNNNNNIVKRELEDISCVDTNSLKHPVGLEAIKEMTRNKNMDNQT